MDTTNILNEIEKDKLIAFAEDKVMFEAAKKYLLAYLYNQGVVREGEPAKGNVNFALRLAWSATDSNGMPRSNEELGADLRAFTHAIKIIESGFAEFAGLTREKKDESVEENPAV